MKRVRSTRPRSRLPALETPQVRILVAGSGVIQSQLLARALRGRNSFKIATIPFDLAALHEYFHSNPVDVVLLTGHQAFDFGLLRWLHVSHPNVAPLLLIDSDDRELIVSAFRAGVRGIFPFTQAPFRMLCKCITRVAGGEIWINNQQMQYVLAALSEVSTLRVVNSNGKSMLTAREEQVVALVVDGLSNREVASELGLSEHTIKTYLMRIFDKLGISTRVELVLYAVSHGENRQAEWMPGGV
jgi:DNA-binding NarL/FixJ family response regulator